MLRHLDNGYPTKTTEKTRNGRDNDMDVDEARGLRALDEENSWIDAEMATISYRGEGKLLRTIFSSASSQRGCSFMQGIRVSSTPPA